MSNDDSNSQASPVLARHTILQGGIVDPFRVRIYEFLNYYDLSYENPEDVPATVGLQMRRTNAELGEFVLLAYAQGHALTNEARRPMNLVFSLDTSGSMEGEPMARLKDSMWAIAGSLKAGDVVSAVTWNTAQLVPLDSHAVTGPDDPALLAMIDALSADGGTDLNAGLTQAYALAQANYGADRLNRVVLISDGGANAGITEIDLIAQAAGDSDGEGIYMVGVGVGDAASYRDDLMDAVTDAGKGAYVFVDTPAEAERTFGPRFVQTMDVAARNVQLELTMPWYFAITEFHGEEYSADPAEVEPQHLAPNDAMSYHQLIQACDPSQILTTDAVKAKVTYEHPISRVPMVDELELPIGEIVVRDASQLYKGDVVVAFAQSLIVIGSRHGAGDTTGAQQVATDMVAWLDTAFVALGDPEIQEMRDLMQTYVGNL
jgi:Ca-activated chloride channel family protein